jgi:hypothetical protein
MQVWLWAETNVTGFSYNVPFLHGRSDAYSKRVLLQVDELTENAIVLGGLDHNRIPGE